MMTISLKLSGQLIVLKYLCTARPMIGFLTPRHIEQSHEILGKILRKKNSWVTP